MATTIQNAAKGQRKAMVSLYEANKQKAFFFAQGLLLDDRQAADAVNAGFKTTWNTIGASGITTEAEFTQLLLRKTAEVCKKKIGQQNSKAFRLPQNKNFAVTVEHTAENTGISGLLNQLPALQRFVFVLHHVGGYSNDALALFFKFDVKTIEIAMEAEAATLERMGIQADQAVPNAQKQAAIPAELETAAAAVIDAIAVPVEKEEKRKRNMITGISAGVLAVCIVVAIFIAMSIYNPPMLEENLTYFADIEIKDYGTITVQLDQKAAPLTCANFVYLANSGFYDGLTIHRVYKEFVIQGGDPKADGTGGSKHEITGEFAENGIENPISHVRGTISMARSGDPNSASSQFFIVHKDAQKSLDGKYAGFGHVIEGMEVVDEICENVRPMDSNGTVSKSKQPIITSVKIRTEPKAS